MLFVHEEVSFMLDAEERVLSLEYLSINSFKSFSLEFSSPILLVLPELSIKAQLAVWFENMEEELDELKQEDPGVTLEMEETLDKFEKTEALLREARRKALFILSSKTIDGMMELEPKSLF